MSTELLNISFRLMTDRTFCLSMKSSLLISDVKVLIQTDSEIAPENQRLIFKGQLLKDEFTLKSYGVESGNTIHVVGRPIRPQETEPSGDNAQQSTGNDRGSGEGSEVVVDGQISTSGSRGIGVPVGLFMSPIYATISVSTPVSNGRDNSMEQVATQFFSGVVNTLLSSFNGTSTGQSSQRGTAQAEQPRDELVSELEKSTGILKRVTSTVSSLSRLASSSMSSGSSANNDSRTAPETTTTGDSVNVASENAENAADIFNSREASASDKVETAAERNAVQSGISRKSSLRNKKNDSQSRSKPNLVEVIDRSSSYSSSNGLVLDRGVSSRSSRFKLERRSNSAPEGYDGYAASLKRGSSNPSRSEEMKYEDYVYDNPSINQTKKEDKGEESDAFEARRGKVRLMDPELVTSKLPWDCLYKLEQHVYEMNYGYKVDYSDSVSYSRNGASGGTASRGGTFIRRPSFTRIEMSSPCYLADEPVSFNMSRSSSEGSEHQRRLIESDEPSSLDEFLGRLESLNARLNETINRYDSGDRTTQLDTYKHLSMVMAIQSRIYASMCAIFSWMHMQMIAPDLARNFSSRMGWNGSASGAQLTQSGPQNDQGGFSFTACSTYVPRDHENSAQNTHSSENSEEPRENSSADGATATPSAGAERQGTPFGQDQAGTGSHNA
ncbi:uncharacterized protein TOT_030000439 [Theileria orientalis strain Shintoku]|uniref:Ubiquitin-like domain-containing protein n=1 Tax=Theileria orientalis strain Shintoku TaxID=869250 RepID=J4C3X1_THEOR|nr:uncharacterized protein TOT_030000439 [Theileria orientalis strain Shintoku]BAM41176.1 uncharacterized protein TOT_030000439 [Theileria orientalis strain Shintoku]|eukprot:XP_009691477.1 uncharacterized protein TOT_030000439 [Theileria orientalis strain Shintoku]